MRGLQSDISNLKSQIQNPLTLTLSPGVPGARGSARLGFTFLEILFAIMVLGIGFILVAAMFPAAIRQTQATVDETAGSSVWIDMHRKLIEVAKNPTVPTAVPVSPPVSPLYVLDQYMLPSGNLPFQTKVLSFFDVRVNPSTTRFLLWSAVAANIIVDSDPRYACIPLYRRDPGPNPNPAGLIGAPSATVFLIPVRSRNKAIFDTSDLTNPSAAPASMMAFLNPTLMKITVYPPDLTGVPSITFTAIYDRNRTLSGVAPVATALAATDEDTPLTSGGYVIVSDAQTAPLKNGQIYRLGARTTTGVANAYYIAPDPQGATDVYATAPTPFVSFTADAFVVGRGFNGTNYDGPNQALGVIPVSIQIPH